MQFFRNSDLSNLDFYKFLASIYGIGFLKKRYLFSVLGLKSCRGPKNLILSDLCRKKIGRFVNNNIIYGTSLQRNKNYFITLYKLNGSYRGKRLKLGLPTNGQRTHSNHRTASKRIF